MNGPTPCLPPETYVVGLGGNLGARRATLRFAMKLLAATPGVTVVASSRVYETEPLGPSTAVFLNAAVCVHSDVIPETLLAHCHAVEAQLGRARKARWAARNLDLDLLLGPAAHTSPTLELPHAALRKRAFALAPLHDLFPEHAEKLGHCPVQNTPPVYSDGVAVLPEANAGRFIAASEAEVIMDSLTCLHEGPWDTRVTLERIPMATPAAVPAALVTRLQQDERRLQDATLCASENPEDGAETPWSLGLLWGTPRGHRREISLTHFAKGQATGGVWAEIAFDEPQSAE